MRWFVVLALAACGGGHGKPDGAVSDTPGDMATDTPRDSGPDADPNNPPTLYDTGLCADLACNLIAAGISTYTPAYALWSDAASKRRWIELPAGATIDTTDPDHWEFPVGTKLWKEFTSQDANNNPVRVETRFIWRQAMGTTNDWFYVSYEWNAAQPATVAVPAGDPNANGTQHDIPPRFQCKQCHEGISSRVLGFAATNALGYLHANCGHCHNPQSKVYTGEGVTMELRLTVGSLGALSTTPVYQTAVDHDATFPIDGLTKRIVSRDPTHSILIDRFTADPTSAKHMPLIGAEVTDQTAAATLTDWITNIQ